MEHDPKHAPAPSPLRPFEPEVEAELGRRMKKELRKSMQRIRSTIPAAARRNASLAIAARLVELGLLAGARGVALFRPIARKGEVDATAIDAAVRAAGGRVAYPFLDEPEWEGPFDPAAPPPPPTMGFRWVDVPQSEGALSLGSPGSPGSLEEALEGAFEERGHGFPEPRADAPRAEADAIDLVIVPGLAFDPRGHRIGYGAGFYDRFLAPLSRPSGAAHARAVGVCFDFQVLAEAPTSPEDVAVAVVVTDKRVFTAGQ
jgi:5-formyltetrahydrofolate cyclo-ligase